MSDTDDPMDDGPRIIGAADDELPHNMRDVSHVIAYDVPEDELVDARKMKARWVLTVVTGKRAEDLDARLDAWFIKALQWLRDNPPETGKGQENAHGSTRKAD